MAEKHHVTLVRAWHRPGSGAQPCQSCFLPFQLDLFGSTVLGRPLMYTHNVDPATWNGSGGVLLDLTQRDRVALHHVGFNTNAIVNSYPYSEVHLGMVHIWNTTLSGIERRTMKFDWQDRTINLMDVRNYVEQRISRRNREVTRMEYIIINGLNPKQEGVYDV